MITVAQLAEIISRTRKQRLADYVAILNPAMEEYGINTPRREAAFIATCLHESAEFEQLIEIWGPTKAQLKYEGRADLGNTKPGDGFKYRGRGIIMITGRANYQAVSDALGYDFVFMPDALASPYYAVHAACWWWKEHGCNKPADKGDFEGVTRIVNGGLTGWKSRKQYYDLAMAALKPDFSNVKAGVATTAK